MSFLRNNNTTPLRRMNSGSTLSMQDDSNIQCSLDQLIQDNFVLKRDNQEIKNRLDQLVKILAPLFPNTVFDQNVDISFVEASNQGL